MRPPSPNKLATLKSERVLSPSFIENWAGIPSRVAKSKQCGDVAVNQILTADSTSDMSKQDQVTQKEAYKRRM